MVTYTNRKGVTYYLRRGIGPTGKVRYFFVRERESDKGEPVDEVPAGYAISESVNAVVSLARRRESPLRPEEVETVATAVRRHPKARDYRIVTHERQIIVYEYAGVDTAELLRTLHELGVGGRISAEKLRAKHERDAQYAPVLRFTLVTSQPATGPREFRVERWCYRGSVNGWLTLHFWGDLSGLVQQTMPTLGTDAFFELY